ncbi:MAG: 4-hydroxythreonine-4-phosphate dehydrogenase PdxA, partial [Gammaproteobacteria bacterium]|nr:4-hydroxythreonine-4-phosphate dehydrogenase PdxA [Gammaproteobacteria bacterium]
MSRLIVSTGEPAGIGPDIMLATTTRHYDASIITVGDPALFQQRARDLGLNVSIREVDLTDEISADTTNTLNVYPVPVTQPVIAGQLNPENAQYVLDVLDVCINACLQEHADAMVTGPIQKSILNSVYPNFSGHTEYLAEKTQSALPVMMLATEGLRVALVTTHLPLKDVAAQITQERVETIIRILHRDMQNQFGIAHPKILIAGLNPHAGEHGHL